MSSVLMLLLLAACQHGPILKITSNAPARIEKNGVGACESTPCQTGGHFYHDPLVKDLCTSGADNRLEAFPLEPNNGFRQSKVVTASCDQIIDVFFDMSSGGAVNMIGGNKMSESSVADKIILLQNLNKKNLISNEEYRSKKKELLDKI